MSKEMRFLVFAIEHYRQAKGLTGPGGGGSLSRKRTLAICAGQLLSLPHRVARPNGCRH